MAVAKPADFRTRNHYDWKIILEQIFPFGIPERAQWSRPTDIQSILTHAASVQFVNQIVFPHGASLELASVTAGPVADQLSLNCGGDFPHVVKPATLYFESFGEQENCEWNYFRLETQQLEPMGGDTTEPAEDLVELSAGQYQACVSSRKKLPARARLVCRVLSGSIVLFMRNCSYIYSSAPVRAKHMEYDVDGFRQHIDELRESFNKVLAAPVY